MDPASAPIAPLDGNAMSTPDNQQRPKVFKPPAEPGQQLPLCWRRVQPAGTDSGLRRREPAPELPAGLALFASVNNLFNRKYTTWAILSDPTGVGAPGVPLGGVTNGPGIDNRFLSPAAPITAFVGMRIAL